MNDSPQTELISTQIQSISAQFEFEIAFALIDEKAELRYAHGDLDTNFALASVSKLFSSYAVLIAVDKGLLSLETPAVDGSCNVRELLSHAAGFAFDSLDYLAKPAKRRMYSNAGIEAAITALEKAAGVSFFAWVQKELIDPLELEGLVLQGSGAKDFSASVDDLLKLGIEYLKPTLISSELAEAMRTVQFAELSGVVPGFGRQNPNPWGLGPEIKGEKSPHWTGKLNSPQTFGHFGQSGSFLWVDPKLGLSAAFLGVKPFSEQHAKLWPELNDLLIEFHQGQSVS